MITIYTTETCPKCKILKQRLDSKKIPYQEITDLKILEEKNIDIVPQIQIDDNPLMGFGEMIKWIKSLED